MKIKKGSKFINDHCCRVLYFSFMEKYLRNVKLQLLMIDVKLLNNYLKKLEFCLVLVIVDLSVIILLFYCIRTFLCTKFI